MTALLLRRAGALVSGVALMAIGGAIAFGPGGALFAIGLAIVLVVIVRL